MLFGLGSVLRTILLGNRIAACSNAIKDIRTIRINHTLTPAVNGKKALELRSSYLSRSVELQENKVHQERAVTSTILHARTCMMMKADE